MSLLQSWVAFRDANTFESSIVVWFAHAFVVVLIAWLIAEVFAKRFSATRYGIWIIASLSLLVLAGVTLLASPLQISLRLLPEETVESVTNETTNINRTAMTVDKRSASVQNVPAEHVLANLDSIAISAPVEEQVANAQLLPNLTPISPASSKVANKEITTKRVVLDWQLIAVWLYAIGVLFMLSRVVVGHIQLQRLKRRSSPLSESSMNLAQECAREIGLSACPMCLQSEETSVPMVVGIFRRSVLLPTNFTAHESSVRRHCLLHEMAHVDHFDGFWNLIGEITSAIYWFHPAVSLARKKLRQTREYAADDRVLDCCESKSAYSRTLLSLTELAGSTPNEPFGIGATTHVERRIKRVLEPSFRSRRMPKWCLLFPAALFIAISICALQFERAIAQRPATAAPPVARDGNSDAQVKEQVTNEASNTSLTLYEKFANADVLESNKDIAEKRRKATVVGTVTDEDQPVANAIVLVRLTRRNRSVAREPLKSIPIVARARTDKNGRYSATFFQSTLFGSAQQGRLELLVADESDRIKMDMRMLSSAQARAEYSARIDVQMVSSETLKATVQTSGGDPIAGVEIDLKKAFVRCKNANTGDPFGRHAVLDDPFSQSRRFTNHVFEFPSDQIRPTSKTRQDGLVVIPGAYAAIVKLEKNELFARTPLLHMGNVPSGYAIQYKDTLKCPASIEMESEIVLSTRIVDNQNRPVNEFKAGFMIPSWQQQQKPDGSISTTKSYLRKATNRQGKLRVYSRFPSDSGLVPLEEAIDLEELVRSRVINLKTHKGIWLSGRVLTADTKVGLKDVSVRWFDSTQDGQYTIHKTLTNSAGNWKLIAPRKQGLITVSGRQAGYELGFEPGPIQANPELVWNVPLDHDAQTLQVPDFEINPVNPLTIVVVDSSGMPVADASVTSNYQAPFQTESGTSAWFRAELAPSATTDETGRCILKPTRSAWKNGMVSVSKALIPDDAKSDRDVMIQSGKAVLRPSTKGIVKVVLVDHVLVQGKVLVDGRPHPKIRVGLATRTRKDGPFDKYYNGFFDANNGSFGFKTEPTGEYAIMLYLRETETGPEKQYFYQVPITKSETTPWDVGTISIKSGQLKDRIDK